MFSKQQETKKLNEQELTRLIQARENLNPDLKQIRINNVSGLTFIYENVTYEWGGGFGNLFSSKERGVKQGDLRAMGNVIVEATISSYNKKFFGPPNICWKPVAEVNMDWIRALKKEIFSCKP